MAYNGTRIDPKRYSADQLGFFVVLIPLAVFMVLPIIFIIFHALKPMDELFAFPPKFFVDSPSLENFTKLFITSKGSLIPLSRYVFNSLIVTITVVFGSIIIASLAGFALSKMKFRSKGAIFEINNAALMFVPVAVTIPRYLTIERIGIIDTYLAHILPLLAMPVGLFLIKQFIDQVPDSLIEAAVIDGAGPLKVYRKVVIPLIKPALATGAILAFQAVWNNIETSSLFTSTESIRTLSFYMNTLASQQANIVAGQGMAAAASLIMFLPNIILFIILQSNVMNAMAHSGLK